MSAAALVPAAPAGRRRASRRGVLPGFGLTMGLTLFWLSAIVLLPLAALIAKSTGLGPSGFARVLGDPRVLAALRVSFGVSLAAACINAVFGVLVAWVLTRYDFPGRRLLDAAVDLPFAIPTAVAGIALASIYAPNGWIGGLVAPFGAKIAFTPWGILIALVAVGLPFVVRTVQPVIAESDREAEEASATLGASRLRTFRRVLLPPLIPAILTGFALSLARCVGEYGSVIFIAGNLPYVSEILPLLIVVKLEEYDYAGATGLAAIMLAISFGMLLVINLIQAWTRRRTGDA
ncbi:sulfate ABC transporter permease subunit CysT [Alsobacter sp. SYSU M60028]|uniref:Sulfate transport system permease protein CysT n=1 Tax=Alsobacter ponti TaxID=2962936 RepID=A0ABT1LA95_9HYPH|nr:sulfate ABC transporter permease subunit CysT [Alsobacter ponti]MCP8938401.1 sulfate ABC transporter permease subunit CysT [Alsobacter ponti]